MATSSKPVRVDIWHNIVWSKYKGEVFSSLNAINDTHEFDLKFFQIAETEGSRVGLSGIDLNHHRYSYTLLFKGSVDNVGLFKRMYTVVKYTRLSNADFTLIAGFHKPEYWAQLCYLLIKRKKMAVFCDSTAHDNQSNVLRSVLKRIFFRSVDGIFCYGARSREYVIRYGANPDYVFRRCQAAALPAGYTPEGALAQRLQLASSPQAPRYLYVGRLSHEKGLDTLLTAFSKLLAQHPSASLMLVGSGAEREALETMAQSLGIQNNVVFAGSKSGTELVEEYLKATCLVLPSTSEPWGLVVNEALSYGCPVVVSNSCGCVPELVIDGKTGFVHAVSDADDLAHKMQAILTQFTDVERTARDCLDVISTYSPDAAATQILHGIRKILSRNAR